METDTSSSRKLKCKLAIRKSPKQNKTKNITKELNISAEGFPKLRVFRHQEPLEVGGKEGAKTEGMAE